MERRFRVAGKKEQGLRMVIAYKDPFDSSDYDGRKRPRKSKPAKQTDSKVERREREIEQLEQRNYHR